jgi:hypothetical protein
MMHFRGAALATQFANAAGHARGTGVLNACAIEGPSHMQAVSAVAKILGGNGTRLAPRALERDDTS